MSYTAKVLVAIIAALFWLAGEADAQETAGTGWEIKAHATSYYGLKAIGDATMDYYEYRSVTVAMRFGEFCTHDHGGPLVCPLRLRVYDDEHDGKLIARCQVVVVSTPRHWRFPRNRFQCPIAWWPGDSRPAQRPDLNDLRLIRVSR